MFKKICLVSILALALVVGASASPAFATLTFDATSVTGSGALTLDGAAASALTVGSATTTGNIAIGGALTTGTLTLGKTTQTGITVISGSTSGANTLFDNVVGGTIAIGVANTGGINIGAGATIQPINIGTGAAAKTIAIGGGTGTLAINTGDWDISTTGAMTGIGAVTTDGNMIVAGGTIWQSQTVGVGDGVSPSYKGIYANITVPAAVTGGTQYIKALQGMVTSAVSSSPAETWGVYGINNVGGGAIAAYGTVGEINATGTGTVGTGAVNTFLSAGYFHSDVAATMTISGIQDVPLVGIIESSTGRRKADAAVGAVLAGAISQSTAGAGAAFKAYDFNTGANFDYGLDLFYSSGSYSNVFGTADIRLSNGETIDNLTDGTIKLTANTGTVTTENHAVDVVASGTFTSGNMVGLNSVLTPVGSGGTWASGIYAKVVQAGSQRVSGYMSGGEFEIVNSVAGASNEMFPLVLDANNNSTYHPASSFIWMQDFGGGSKMPNLLTVTGTTLGTTDATTLISTVSSAHAATHQIKVQINGVTYWLLATTTAP